MCFRSGKCTYETEQPNLCFLLVLPDRKWLNTSLVISRDMAVNNLQAFTHMRPSNYHPPQSSHTETMGVLLRGPLAQLCRYSCQQFDQYSLRIWPSNISFDLLLAIPLGGLDGKHPAEHADPLAVQIRYRLPLSLQPRGARQAGRSE